MGRIKYWIIKYPVEKFLTSNYIICKIIKALKKNLQHPPLNSRFILNEVIKFKPLANFLYQFYQNKKKKKGLSTRMIRTFILSEGGNGLLTKILDQTNKKQTKTFIRNILVRMVILFHAKREIRKLPKTLTLIISPTMRCNLKCRGCYAGNYTKEVELSYQTLDKIFKEARKLDISFISISGGEAFIRKDILKLFKKYDSIWFQVYTNGTLINDNLVKKLVNLGNVSPVISIEGFEKDTDFRRGKGTYKKIIQAMDKLNKHKLLFGFSATGIVRNAQLITSKKFIDFLIEKGCAYGWYFHYQPIGLKPSTKLMLKPIQREKICQFTKETRLQKPIFLIDFLADGAYINGCMAAGKRMVHINNKGDIEPCVFCHFAVDNIHKTSLRKALDSEFFKAIRQEQPYCENLLTPCLIADHTELYLKLIKKYHAKPTHPGAESIVEDKELLSFLKKYQCHCHKILDKKWKKNYCPELESEI